jgi:hypothetical protein
MSGRARQRSWWGVVAVLTLAGGVGCVAAAAGAGAGTGVYLTSRGAKGVVNGTVTDVVARARVVLEQNGVEVNATRSEQKGDQQELEGKKGDLDIKVTLEKESATTTRAEVSARKNLVTWDKDYARELLDKIVKAAGT